MAGLVQVYQFHILFGNRLLIIEKNRSELIAMHGPVHRANRRLEHWVDDIHPRLVSVFAQPRAVSVLQMLQGLVGRCGFASFLPDVDFKVVGLHVVGPWAVEELFLV